MIFRRTKLTSARPRNPRRLRRSRGHGNGHNKDGQEADDKVEDHLEPDLHREEHVHGALGVVEVARVAGRELSRATKRADGDDALDGLEHEGREGGLGLNVHEAELLGGAQVELLDDPQQADEDGDGGRDVLGRDEHNHGLGAGSKEGCEG